MRLASALKKKGCDIMLSNDLNKLMSVANEILEDEWCIQYVNVEIGTYELRAYTCKSMCLIIVEDDDFEHPSVLYYDYRKEK